MLQHVASVLKALKVANLTANPLKCEWGGRQILNLGHVVGDGRLAVPEDRARTMLDYKQPKTKSGLRSFLGLISYYRRFIKNVADFTAVLTPAISRQAPNRIQWDEPMVSAFSHLCSVLVDVCMLTVPVTGDMFIYILMPQVLV